MNRYGMMTQSLSHVERPGTVPLEKYCHLQLGALLIYFDPIVSTLQFTTGSARWQLNNSVPKLRASPAAKLCSRPWVV
jgi:hypothetical protein